METKSVFHIVWTMKNTIKSSTKELQKWSIQRSQSSGQTAPERALQRTVEDLETGHSVVKVRNKERKVWRCAAVFSCQQETRAALQRGANAHRLKLQIWIAYILEKKNKIKNPKEGNHQEREKTEAVFTKGFFLWRLVEMSQQRREDFCTWKSRHKKRTGSPPWYLQMIRFGNIQIIERRKEAEEMVVSEWDKHQCIIKNKAASLKHLRTNIREEEESDRREHWGVYNPNLRGTGVFELFSCTFITTFYTIFIFEHFQIHKLLI